ncbi:hypothetical protein EEB14_45845 [Rhodococcus sp. WS4]|nr:hypothetical protein EEB14_45845 [Rhodococcus sp. WS4]
MPRGAYGRRRAGHSARSATNTGVGYRGYRGEARAHLADGQWSSHLERGRAEGVAAADGSLGGRR